MTGYSGGRAVHEEARIAGIGIARGHAVEDDIAPGARRLEAALQRPPDRVVHDVRARRSPCHLDKVASCERGGSMEATAW